MTHLPGTEGIVWECEAREDASLVQSTDVRSSAATVDWEIGLLGRSAVQERPVDVKPQTAAFRGNTQAMEWTVNRDWSNRRM